MSNLFRLWLLIAYAITVPLIIFFASMSILSALIIWVFYIPACVLDLLLIDRFYMSAGFPLLFRRVAHACMAVMLFLRLPHGAE